MSGVYFIHTPELGDKSRFKIGWSKNIPKRLKELQTGNGFELKLYKCISTNDRTLETTIHQSLSLYRKQGEWFELSEEQVDVIVSIFTSTSMDEKRTLINEITEIIEEIKIMFHDMHKTQPIGFIETLNDIKSSITKTLSLKFHPSAILYCKKL